MKIKLAVFLVVFLVVVKIAYADKACDPAMASCLPEVEFARCIAQICFIDSKSRIQFETENNCKIKNVECTNEINQIPLEVLKVIFPSSKSMLKLISEELDLALKLDGAKHIINTKRKLAHFLAQVKQEVGSEARVLESLNYPPERLVKKFNYYKKLPKEAQQDGRLGPARNPTRRADQVAIANKAYGNRYGNGDAESGDGWKYRGRGFIQLTFKNNYLGFEKEYKKIWNDDVSFVDNPDLVIQDKYVIRSALSFWSTNNLTSIAEKGLSKKVSNAITAKINLYTDSYDARFENLKNIMKMDFFKEC